MPLFKYEVVDRAGAVARGRVEAKDAEDLIRRFRAEGRLVLSVEAARDGFVPGVGVAPASQGAGERVKEGLKRFSAGVKLGTLVLFTGQLAAMLGAGLHLVRILSTLGRETPNRTLKKTLADVTESVTGGSTLADALARHPHIFNRLYVAVVRAGELGGSLPLVLDTLTTYLEKVEQLRRKVRGAFAYPSVVLSVAILIVFVMIWKIVPIFENVYARSTVALPLPTRILIAVSKIVQEYTLVSFLALLLLGVLFFLAIQIPRIRYLFDAFKLRLPLFGLLIRKAVLARVCRTLSVLLQSGMQLIEAMETASRVAGNRVIERALVTASIGIRDGETIAETLRRTRQFPEMVTQLVATGEESGTLPAMLSRAAVYYEQQVDNSVATLSSLIEPILIVFLGVIVGSVLISLYLPIFKLGQAIRGGIR